MQGDSKQSIWLKLLTVVVFILFSAGSLAAFGYYAFQLILDLLHKEEVIAFNKGAMHMLGVGLSGGLLIYFMIYEIIYGKISESLNKKATRLAFIFMGSIFIFPRIIDYGVRQYIGHTGYVFCADQSHRWLHAQNLVFASNEEACTKFNGKERTAR
ncbi:MAG: hypothetical protein M8364_14020 [Methylobacter sp.]|uniref:hypothetical protein n=1 Tax=Methylobacter sp. TaxID=2051955 RepID=UPI00258AACFA|nr:hypothetical protein [Methylobacter sp.]MCL7422012.1 hypothetical protein [Methylobacter sp.]